MIELTEIVEAGGVKVYATLTLPLELRQKSRQRAVLDNGKEAAIFLKRGTVLKNGDCLSGPDDLIIQVQAADERLSSASCSDPLLFARACYHLGNRHMPLQIEPHRILYLHDHVLDDMLLGLGLTVTAVTEPFEPEPGAYGGSATGAGSHHHAH